MSEMAQRHRIASRGAGSAMHRFAEELYPINRSLTGDGVRQTLEQVGRRIPLQVIEVPTGTPVLDWTVPREWRIRDAWIDGPNGERIVSFSDHNLHVMGYSVPVRRRMPLPELQEHLFSLPEQPDLIPYRTSYYNEDWAFCVTDAQRRQLPEGEYDICIDSSLEDGSLTYGECYLPGEEETEVLISCHVCHPSLANDNLSGIVVATWLAESLASRARRLSYRFVFVPGTIGAIAWLARNEQTLSRISHGLVLTGIGDPGHSTYKRSRRGDADIDRAFAHVLEQSGEPYELQEFSPWGYDERQYCSPGFNLPVGCLMRTPHGHYPEYHTSADDLDFVRPDALESSFRTCLSVFEVLEENRTYVNLSPKGEPQLGRRGLYAAIGGDADRARSQLALLWVLNFSDGTNTLLDIAQRASLPFDVIRRAADILRDHDLLAEAASS
jgi:aminopeptidase-like protein